MTENNIPATEAEGVGADDSAHYEFAFHILPTVAEEEVPAVFGHLKTLIDEAGGVIEGEEAPQRLELAYPIVKHLEGHNERHVSSYFGWVRFGLLPEKLDALKVEIDHEGRVLRSLIIRLTKKEIAEPVKIFEVVRKEKTEAEKTAEPQPEVSMEQLEKTLDEITSGNAQA